MRRVRRRRVGVRRQARHPRVMTRVARGEQFLLISGGTLLILWDFLDPISWPSLVL